MPDCFAPGLHHVSQLLWVKSYLARSSLYGTLLILPSKITPLLVIIKRDTKCQELNGKNQGDSYHRRFPSFKNEIMAITKDIATIEAMKAFSPAFAALALRNSSLFCFLLERAKNRRN
jgi:hypothetical protein